MVNGTILFLNRSTFLLCVAKVSNYTLSHVRVFVDVDILFFCVSIQSVLNLIFVCAWRTQLLFSEIIHLKKNFKQKWSYFLAHHGPFINRLSLFRTQPLSDCTCDRA